MSNDWKVVQMLDAWAFDSRIQEIGADRVIKEAAAEIEKLRAAIKMALDCIEDVDVIGARQTLTKALGEKE